MQSFARYTRVFLDRLYVASAILAALFIISILFLIVLQMVARWTGEVFVGVPDYAGYSMAAASFFAFANALGQGAHIRVGILLKYVSKRNLYILEIWCFTIAAALLWYFTYYAFKAAYWSWKFHDVSQGQDATPLWIPQSSMVLGSLIFAIAITDNLVNLIFFGKHNIDKEVV